MSREYQEYHFYSAVADCHMSRISMFNDRGDEFYIHVPLTEGKTYREARLAAIDDIDAAIIAGREPGEVRD